MGTKGFDPVRIFYSWGLVTFVTFMMLVGATLLFESGSLKAVFYSHYGSFLVLGETIVVGVEALVLFWMTRIKFFWLREVQPLRFGRALRYSVIANIASFVSGFLWIIYGESLFEEAIWRIIR